MKAELVLICRAVDRAGKAPVGGTGQGKPPTRSDLFFEGKVQTGVGEHAKLCALRGSHAGN